MLTEILHDLGLREPEVAVYIALLKFNGVSAGALAQRLSLPRPTVYGYLERLQHFGLAQVSTRDGVKKFYAEHPRQISHLFDQQVESLQAQQRKFAAILPEIERKMGLRLVRPRLQFLEGKDSVQQILQDMLNFPGSETMSFWPIKAMLGALSPDYFRYHNKQRIKHSIYVRAIWPEKHIVSFTKYPFLGSGKGFHREIRRAPAGVDFTMGYWLYGDRIACLSSARENYGFILESPEFCAMQRAQFEIVWQQSTPLKTTAAEAKAFLAELSD